MSRSRMVDDGFWDDPELSELTLEQRTALLLFLTCPQSNVIGVFRVIWRQIGAGAGWTQDQLLNAARDLEKKGCIEIDEATAWVWVKEWWKHNNIRAAFVGNVSKKAIEELAKVPEFWRVPVEKWLVDNGREAPCKPLLSPSPSPFQGAGGNPTPTHNPIFNHHQMVDDQISDLVEAAVWTATGKINNPSAYRRAVRQRIADEGPSPEDWAALTRWRAWCEQQQADATAQANKQKAAIELKAINDQKRQAAESFLVALDAKSRAEIERQFQEWLLAKKQRNVLDVLGRTGIDGSPMVFSQFLEFFSTLHHPQPEEAAA